MEETEPHVQRLFHGPYLERGMGSKDLAGVWLCGFTQHLKKHMNAAEVIVQYWLQNKGYFLQTSISLSRNKEIDILAIHENGEKLHVEVSVSIKSKLFEGVETLAPKECAKKFGAVENDVKKILGEKYKKLYVRGRIGPENGILRERYFHECERMGIEIKRFEDVIDEVVNKLSQGRSLNPIIDAVQLSSTFLKN